MKKALFSIVAIVMMVFAVSALTGCSENTVQRSMSVRSTIVHSLDVTPETRDAIDAADALIKARIVKIFGTTFMVPCDDNGVITTATMHSYDMKIDEDKEIQNIVNGLALLKDRNDNPAVRNVTFDFYTGTETLWQFKLVLVPEEKE